MTGGVRRSIVSAVYRTDRHEPVNVCLSQPAWSTTAKKIEHNLIVRSSKSEAEHALDVWYRLLKLLTDTKHRAASLRQQGYLINSM